MRAFFAAISDTGGGSASSATTAATAAAGAGPNVYARAVARGESLYNKIAANVYKLESNLETLEITVECDSLDGF